MTTTTALKSYANLVDGELTEGDTWIEVVNPATEQPIGRVPDADAATLDRAVAAARTAYSSWSKRPVEERRAVLQQMGAAIKANSDELMRLLTSEQGKPHAQATGEILGAAGMAGALASLNLDDKVTEDSDTRKTTVRRVPIGVVGAIVPWNFPVLMAVQKIAPALLAGNTMVLKPSPFTPLATLRLAELVAGIVPAGVLNIITGGDALGPLITSHPGIDKVSFTGSTATGKKVMESASADLKRITLELGGNDAAIVLPDADPKKTAAKVFWAAFTNAGQICIAAKRVYVHKDIYDDFAAALTELARSVKVGDGAEQGTTIGPIQNKRQFERVTELVADAHDKGYKFLVGGDTSNVPGYFMPVSILDNPPEDARIVAEEQFGPVLPIMRVDSAEEALERANASEYGLAGSVWTSDPEAGFELAKRMETGTVWVNEALHLSPFAPFGGHKNSGFGAELGEEGLHEFTYPQTISVKKDKVAA